MQFTTNWLQISLCNMEFGLRLRLQTWIQTHCWSDGSCIYALNEAETRRLHCTQLNKQAKSLQEEGLQNQPLYWGHIWIPVAWRGWYMTGAKTLEQDGKPIQNGAMPTCMAKMLGQGTARMPSSNQPKGNAVSRSAPGQKSTIMFIPGDQEEILIGRVLMAALTFQ